MRFGLLGTLTVGPGPDPRGAAPPRPLGSAKLRALLAALLAAPGRPVPAGALRTALWGDAPPPTATASLHNHVARLRRVLAERGGDPARLRAATSGYLLALDGDGVGGPDEVDVLVFRAHHAAARAAHRTGDWPAVLRESAAALAPWRGEPLADVPMLEEGLRALAAHLTEARLLTLEWRFDAELALGRHQGLAAELAGLAAAHPLRETFHRQLMLALHRTHRQAEALAVYHALRRTLVDELGVEPHPAVRAAHREILAAPRAPAPADHPVPPLPVAARAAGPPTDGPSADPPDPAVSAAATDAAADAAAAEAADAQAADAGRCPPRPAQLPAGVPDFTGRTAALDTLLRTLRKEPDGHAPRVVVVSGMGGVGKTALAVRAAHLVCEEFPGGQLYADLRGFGAGGARRPADLIARFLSDLGVDGRLIPDDPDDRAVLWRDTLHGRRLLLMLDNAADAAQVAPLLPGGGGTAVLVTSRRTLADLPGAVRLPLEPLPEAEQRALLARVCGEDRVAAEPAAAAGVLAACGGLPLALRIAGARLAARPTWTVGALAERLEARGGRLHALAAGGLALRDTFAMSYLAMRDSPAACERAVAAAFRGLGLWPGQPLGPAAAAALLGPDAGPGGPAGAEDLLEALVDAHLLETPRPGRYAFHDLVGEYAADRAADEVAPEQAAAALRRLVVWYAAALAASAAVLTPEAHPLPPPDDEPAAPVPAFASDEDAMAWCVRELPAVKEALRVAVARGWPDAAWRLAAGLIGYAQVYWWTGEWTDCLELAMACVTEHGDALGQGWMHSRLGVAHGMSERYEECERHLVAARRFFEESGDRRGLAATLTNLSALHRGTGAYRRALEYGRRSLELHRALGDADRVATVLGNLGDCHLFLGDAEAAEVCFGQALAAWRARGSLVSIARTLTSLGESRIAMGRPAEAVQALEETLEVLGRLGDSATGADVLETLARAHLAGGDHEAARACWREALDRAVLHRLPTVAEAARRGLAGLS
jgi:DNA-binding SARP family transcriptional activator/tetratricopeptide (TPR) repeat protein